MQYNSTTIFKALLFSMLPFVAFTANAQSAEVSGTAEGYAGMKISITVYSDPLSKSVSKKTEAEIDDSGKFDLQIEVDDTCRAMLSLRRYSAPIYLTPGANYRVEISPENERVLINTWQKGELKYTLLNTSTDTTDELNITIAKIDNAYYRFFAQNAQLIGTKQIQINLRNFEGRITGSTSPGSFTGRYASSTFAEMMLAAGLPQKEVYDRAFADGDLHFDNPGWYGLFNLFYESIFEEYSTRFGGAEMYNRLAKGISLEEADSLMVKNDFLEHIDLRRAAMLNAAAGAYYDNRYSARALLSLIEEIAEAPDTADELKRIARDLNTRLTSTGLGSTFSITGSDEMLKSDKETYIFVSAPWSTSSGREAISLAMMKEKYGEFFNVIEISIVENGESYATAERPWEVIVPADVSDFMEQMEIYRIPQFIWVNTDGIVTDLDAPMPGTGLESVLYKKKVAFEKSQKIKVGQ